MQDILAREELPQSGDRNRRWRVWIVDGFGSDKETSIDASDRRRLSGPSRS